MSAMNPTRPAVSPMRNLLVTVAPYAEVSSSGRPSCGARQWPTVYETAGLRPRQWPPSMSGLPLATQEAGHLRVAPSSAAHPGVLKGASESLPSAAAPTLRHDQQLVQIRPTLRGMSVRLNEPDTRDKLATGPTLRSVVALVAAGAAVFCLLFGLSYPGFPMATAAWGVLAAAVAVTLVVASGLRAVINSRGYVRAGVMLTLVALVLAGGVVAAKQDDGAQLAGRWANSRDAFEAEIAAIGTAPLVKAGSDAGYFDRYPKACPRRLGDFRIVECRSLDGGYLYLQAQNALTDDSGIMYLPDGLEAAAEWLVDETVVPLGGPWFSWTCYC